MINKLVFLFRDLGFSEPGKIRNPEKTKAFLYIIEKKVVGCTLAEAIDTGFRVIPEAGIHLF